MIHPSEVAVLDKNSEYLGVSTLELMENAGQKAAEIIREKFDIEKKRVLIMCGMGNNGGDGFVVARCLREFPVEVFLVGSKDAIKTEIARANFEKLSNIVKVSSRRGSLAVAISESDIIVDAMLGAGLGGNLREPYLSCAKAVNSAKGKAVVALDIPTGMGTPDAVKPSITITFHDIKEGMNERNSGTIIVADIGIPREAVLYTGPGDLAHYPIPKGDSHKGKNGRVLIIGGGPYTGAPALAGFGAYRIGADLVRIAVPASNFNAVASYSPNFIVERLSGEALTAADSAKAAELLRSSDALVIGNGAGQGAGVASAIREIIRCCSKPMVADADAIAAIGEDPGVASGKVIIATPHEREFIKLSGKDISGIDDMEQKARVVMGAARDMGIVILLKGKVDIISDGASYKLNRTGNAGMTVGGTGDVLAGVVGGLLSKNVPAYNAARIGAFVCGCAGDLAFEEKWYSLLATDVAEKIPRVLSKFLRGSGT